MQLTQTINGKRESIARVVSSAVIRACILLWTAPLNNQCEIHGVSPFYASLDILRQDSILRMPYILRALIILHPSSCLILSPSGLTAKLCVNRWNSVHCTRDLTTVQLRRICADSGAVSGLHTYSLFNVVVDIDLLGVYGKPRRQESSLRQDNTQMS